MIYKTSKFTLFFGDAATSISTEDIASKLPPQSLEQLADPLQASSFIFLRQEHTAHGFIVGADTVHPSYFQTVGDFIITDQKNIGIGVVTADCLPIILYDPIHHAVGIMHAGWRGLAADIFQKTIESMAKQYQTDPASLQVYLGPSAGSCCYEVQLDFYDRFARYANHNQFFIKKDGNVFFDSRQFVEVLARNLGIASKNIYTTYNACTMCNLQFCSYRRQKDNARRQMSIISLF